MTNETSKTNKQVFWCFTPSQPVRLYRGDQTNKQQQNKQTINNKTNNQQQQQQQQSEGILLVSTSGLFLASLESFELSSRQSRAIQTSECVTAASGLFYS